MIVKRAAELNMDVSNIYDLLVVTDVAVGGNLINSDKTANAWF